jgi:hypothetical protein
LFFIIVGLFFFQLFCSVFSTFLKFHLCSSISSSMYILSSGLCWMSRQNILVNMLRVEIQNNTSNF